MTDDLAWTKATLLVRYGGHGIRCAWQLAPSAYLVSGASSSELIQLILPIPDHSLPFPDLEAALSIWSHDHDHHPPSGKAYSIQKTWDRHKVEGMVVALLENAADNMACAQFWVVSTKESGAWLHALPISTQGIKMDENTICIAVGLRLGTALRLPQHCGVKVDNLATHCLSCRRSAVTIIAMQPSITFFILSWHLLGSNQGWN